jgi:hypothetical protein
LRRPCFTRQTALKLTMTLTKLWLVLRAFGRPILVLFGLADATPRYEGNP